MQTAIMIEIWAWQMLLVFSLGYWSHEARSDPVYAIYIIFSMPVFLKAIGVL